MNTYGPLPNTSLLHTYGFTEPGNPHDVVGRWAWSLAHSQSTRGGLGMRPAATLCYTGCRAHVQACISSEAVREVFVSGGTAPQSRKEKRWKQLQNDVGMNTV